MPNFNYKAVNQEGKTIESVILAPNKEDVMRQLRESNMVLISIKKQQSKKQTGKISLRVKGRTILLFTKQLYTLLKAGVPIITSLNTVIEQTSDLNFKKIIETITRDIEQGSKLSDALGQFPKVFPPLYINSIQVGEISGTLEETLLYIHKYLEDDAHIRAQVKKAMRYPLFVIIGIIGAFIVFMTMVIPNFLPLFQSSGQDLPIPTLILIKMNDIIADYGLIILGVLAVIFCGLICYIRTPKGRFNFDLFKLKLPIFGEFIKKVNISRFAKLFYTMNRTGVSIIEAFKIMQKSMGNEVYNKELKTIADKIITGEKIAGSIKQSPYFTSLLVEMISIGEKSGSLDDMLYNVSEYYDQEVTNTVSNMTSLIEPIITLVLGGMILILILALFLPMWEMMNVM